MKKNRNKKIRNYLIGFFVFTVMFATPIMNTKAELIKDDATDSKENTSLERNSCELDCDETYPAQNCESNKDSMECKKLEVCKKSCKPNSVVRFDQKSLSKYEVTCHDTYAKGCVWDENIGDYTAQQGSGFDPTTGKPYLCELDKYKECILESLSKCVMVFNTKDLSLNLGNLTCEDLSEITTLVKRAYYIALVVLIVLFILLTMMDYMKAVTSGEQDIMKKANKHLVTRIVILGLFILLPVLINLGIKLFLPNIDSCLNFKK